MNKSINKGYQMPGPSPLIPSFHYQLNHYNTLENLYPDSRFSDGSQQETIQERAAFGGIILKQDRHPSSFRTAHLFNQPPQRRPYNFNESLHEIVQVKKSSKMVQSAQERSIKYEYHFSQGSQSRYAGNPSGYDLENEENSRCDTIKFQASFGPILIQKSGLQSLKSQNYSNQSIMKSENRWRSNKIENRSLTHEKGNESSSYTGSNVLKRNKAKRQEISTRFQNSENQEESDRMLEELYTNLSKSEFQELLEDEDFEEYCLSKVGKSYNTSNLKKQEPRPNIYTTHIKGEHQGPSAGFTTIEESIKEEVQSVNHGGQSSGQVMMGEISQWPIQYSDYPQQPRYELKLTDLPDENYDYDEIVEEDNFFGYMF